jgi:GT2 family glycosyltransferase
MIDEALTKTLHRVRFDYRMLAWPRVSIVIPSRDSFALISRILSDLLDRTDYPDYEIIVVDNGTTDPRVLELYKDVANRCASFRVEIEAVPFNFSRQVNRGIDLASGGLVLLLNNDIEVMESEWLREMVSCFEYPDTGIVGARLVFPDGRLQHAGVIVGLGGLAGHWFGGYDANFPGPMGRLHVRQSLTAVTGACMLVSRACLNAVGRFDEDGLGIAYNDVDFCLRAAASGFRTVWTPFATLIHHESLSRGSDEEPHNRARFQRDKDLLRTRYRTDEFEDRAYNPWLGRAGPGVPPVTRDHLPDAR